MNVFDFLRMRSSAIFMLFLVAIAWMPPAAAAEPSVDEMVEALSPKAPGKEAEKPAGAYRMRGRAAKKDTVATPAADTKSSGAGQLRLAVQFEFGSTTITAESQALLLKLALAMKTDALAGLRFQIEGHTDAIGDPQINMRLSSQRAESVRQFLSRAGIEPLRLTAVGKGSSELLDAANPGAAVNRRVVVVSLDSVAPRPAASPQTGKVQQAPAEAGLVSQPADPLSVGTVQQVLGEPSVIRANVSTPLIKGDQLREADKISTNAGSSVLVKLADGAQLLVRSNTSVGLTEMVHQGEPSKLKHTIDLVIGAFRYLTGAVGKTRPEAVRFKTPNLTIGIRGTDVEVAYAPKLRSLKDSGTYVRVNKGEVELGGLDDSIVTLTSNEQAFAGAPGPSLRGGKRAPAVRKLSSPPGVFTESYLDQIVGSE